MGSTVTCFQSTAVYFTSNRAGSWQVWKPELATGREVQVTHHGAAVEAYRANEAAVICTSSQDYKHQLS
jgi:hypothetical protein